MKIALPIFLYLSIVSAQSGPNVRRRDAEKPKPKPSHVEGAGDAKMIGTPKSGPPKIEKPRHFIGMNPNALYPVHGTPSDGPQRIVGGTAVTDPEKYPDFIHLQMGCGASLITPDVALTAAHCGGSDTNGLHALVGAYDRWAWETPFNQPNSYFIEDNLPHPQYNDNTLSNDFMLLKLDRPVPGARPVKLSLNDNDSVPSDGQPLTVIGFGALSSGGSAPSIINEVVVNTVSNEDCNADGSYEGEVFDNMMCAGATDLDSCQGDSGGPIFVVNGANEHVQVGVVSWGYGCGAPDYPGVYARVSSAYDWIKDNACAMSDVDSELCGGGGGGGGDDGGGGGGGGSTCADDKLDLHIQLRTDAWGYETSWTLLDAGGSIIDSVSTDTYGNGQTIDIKKCLDDACYKFVLEDSYGDGLNGSGGGYTITVNGNVVESQDRPDFGEIIELDIEGSNGCSGGDGGGGGDDGGGGGDDGGSNGCDAGLMSLEFVIQTDDWGYETAWKLFDSNDNIVESVDAGTYGDGVSETVSRCLPQGCYVLMIEDTYGDGLINQGEYTVSVDGQQVASGADFGHMTQVAIGGSSCSTGIFECAGNKMSVQFELNTDPWGYETGWMLINENGNIVNSGDMGSYDSYSTYNFNWCLDPKCFTLRIEDSYGDGLNGQNGGYSVDTNGVLTASADTPNFGWDTEIQVGYCEQ